MTRSEELARQYRKILLVIMAGILHAAVLLLNPSCRIEIPESAAVRIRVKLVFLEPRILSVDGAGVPESLAAGLRVANWTQMQLALKENWPEAYQAYRVGGSASVLLRVDFQGHVVEATLAESSGDVAKDEALIAAAGELRYRPGVEEMRWSEIRLIQPLVVERPLTPLQVFVAENSGGGAG